VPVAAVAAGAAATVAVDSSTAARSATTTRLVHVTAASMADLSVGRGMAMEIVLTVIVAVVLTAVVVAVSRAGSSRHQEDLNEHDATSATSTRRSAAVPSRPEEPKTDRPGGPDAEPMGVADAGEPSVDPTAERRS